MSHKIGVIGGDGIGPEVIAEALKVVRAAGVELDTRRLRPRRRAGTCATAWSSPTRSSRSGGASTPSCSAPSAPPTCRPGVIERGLLLKMRFDLDLYINQRPFLAPDGSARLHRDPREHRGHLRRRGRVPAQGHPARGRHPGLGQHPHGRRALRPLRLRAGPQPPERKHLTLVHKTNVLTFAGDLWERTFDEVAAEYPDVTTAYNHVDAACIYFVEGPQRYDVIVTDNLFGDILTDLGGAVSGGIGFAASANLNPARTGPSMFEPVHGSAPDIAGQGKANPVAAIISAAMMLEFLGEADAAARIRKACADTATLTGSTSDDRRPRRRPPVTRGGTSAHHAHREDLDERRARRLGRRPDPRPHPHPALRHGRLRGHPRLRDRPTAPPCSASPSTWSACTTRRRS